MVNTQRMLVTAIIKNVVADLEVLLWCNKQTTKRCVKAKGRALRSPCSEWVLEPVSLATPESLLDMQNPRPLL